jgi:hypothetical protein
MNSQGYAYPNSNVQYQAGGYPNINVLSGGGFHASGGGHVGGNYNVNHQGVSHCSKCGGTGYKNSKKGSKKPCKKCKGHGHSSGGVVHADQIHVGGMCHKCGGTGVKKSKKGGTKPCKSCKGGKTHHKHKNKCCSIL